jgi:predicted enzyme related to lactoylglutathione lyase
MGSASSPRTQHASHGSVEFVSAPEKQPWGEFAVFKDPDRNQFALSSP